MEGIDRRRLARTPEVGDDRRRLTEEREVEAAPTVEETAEVDMVFGKGEGLRVGGKLERDGWIGTREMWATL